MPKTSVSFSPNLSYKILLSLILSAILIGLSGIIPFRNYKVAGQQSDAQSCPTCKPPTEQVIYTPLIDLKEASFAEINLNCRSSHPIDAVPTFYTIEGTPVVGEAIHLLPAEMRFINVQTLIPAAERGKHLWGGMSLTYTGNTMEIWAQMTFHGTSKTGSLNSFFAVADMPRSNTREAVWHMPKNATATIAVGNYSDAPAAAMLTFSNGDVEQINLAPYATEIVRRKNNGQSRTNTEAESVRINASGQIGRLIPTGFVTSNNGDFGSSIRFTDPENTAQPNLYATNFRLKDSTAHIVLKNTTNNPLTARPRFLPAAGEGSGVVELAAVTIPPNAVKEVNLTPLMNAARTRADFDSVSVQIINDGAAGSLIGAANFANNLTGVDYDIPLRDSGTAQNSAGGYPIRLDDDYTTTLSITNVGDKAGKFTMQINYDGGVYAMYPRELAPGATAVFDIRKIRDEQRSDSSGRILPIDLTIGQIRWSQVGGSQTRLMGRSEIISKTGKVSSSYSCGVCCTNSFYRGNITPLSVFSDIGDYSEFTANQQDRDCYGNYYSWYPVSANWTSDDTSIAEMDANVEGRANAIGVGATTIRATWYAEVSTDLGGGECDSTGVTVNVSSNISVLPKVALVAPARGGVGSTTSVEIYGNGFLTGAAVNAGTGITISNVTVVSTQKITADFTIAADATGGNRIITVTVRGQQSIHDPFNSFDKFFVQIPTSLTVLSVTLTPTTTTFDPNVSACSSGSNYGISVSITYQINDQNNPPSPISNTVIIPQETVTDLYINGSRQPDPFPDWGEFSTPAATNDQFIDVPLGVCTPVAFTGSEVQKIRLLIQNTQIFYPVRTNNFVFTGPASGQGSITNNSDIQKSRP